jgi:hypothetical protein
MLRCEEMDRRTCTRINDAGPPQRAASRLTVKNHSGHGRAGGQAGYDGTGLLGTYAGYWPGRNGFPVNIGGG